MLLEWERRIPGTIPDLNGECLHVQEEKKRICLKIDQSSATQIEIYQKKRNHSLASVNVLLICTGRAKEVLEIPASSVWVFTYRQRTTVFFFLISVPFIDFIIVFILPGVARG